MRGSMQITDFQIVLNQEREMYLNHAKDKRQWKLYCTCTICVCCQLCQVPFRFGMIKGTYVTQHQIYNQTISKTDRRENHVSMREVGTNRSRGFYNHEKSAIPVITHHILTPQSICEGPIKLPTGVTTLVKHCFYQTSSKQRPRLIHVLRLEKKLNHIR